ncbi:MAG: 6-hydroxymethylpterin diphosphokinase MptE-like protein [Zestosphaera sp.]
MVFGGLRDEVRWASLHEIVRREFGFDVEEDFNAAEVLNMIIQSGMASRETVARKLRGLVGGARALVVGAGSSCVDVKEVFKHYDVLIAADGALRCCRSVGVEPHVVVTDLDGVGLGDLLTFEGVIVIHAHGDNVGRLISMVPLLKGKDVLGTSQVPLKTSNVSVAGGFTDGDRAVYIALVNGARDVGLVGFDFEGSVGRYSKPYLTGEVPATPVKRRKFYWGRFLIELMGLGSGVEVRYACSASEGPLQASPRLLQV